MKRTTCAVLLGTLLLVGCTSYYKVTDPTTGKTYYSTHVTKNFSGASQLEDARTGETVTIQNSQVSEISKEQFEQGKHGAATTMPAMK